MNALLRIIFKLLGWKVVGALPITVKKAVFAVCPHATWKDFPLGIATRATMKLKIGYLGKAELFKPPFGFIFKALGGIPVVRTENRNMVDSQVDAIKKSDDRLFALAPEGTRKNVGKLRTGFYYMAFKAEIPIIMVGFDFPRKLIVIAEPFMPSGDFKTDMQQKFVPFFRTIEGVQKDWMTNYENGIFGEEKKAI